MLELRVAGRGLILVAVLALLGACRTLRAPPGPSSAPGRPIPAAVVAARRALRGHDTSTCLRLLEEERGLDAGEEERSWLLAHVWAATFRADHARREAARLPRGRFRLALEASLAEDAETGLGQVESARSWPPDPWVRLAAAYLSAAVGASGGAEREAASARGRGSTYVDVETWLVTARAHAEAGRLEEAAAAAERALTLEPTDIRGHAIVAAVDRLRGDWEGAVDVLRDAIRIVPANRGQARLLASILRRAEDEGLARRAGRGLATVEGSTNPEFVALLGVIAEQEGRGPDAIALYRQALEAGAIPVPVDRHLRRLLFAEGAFEEGVAWLLGAVPPQVLEAPGNLLRPAWERLQGAVRDAPERASPVEGRVALAEALVAVGALVEARLVLRDAEGHGAAARLDERLARQVAFEDAIEEDLEGGYRRGHRRKKPADFDALLACMAARAREHLLPDEAAAFQPPYVGVRRVPVFGSWLDHGTDSTSPAVRHFRRYGKFLMLGQREGQPTEAILLSLAHLESEASITTRGRTYRHDVAVGYDRRLSSYLDSQGGGLGGACLPDGIWLDADSAREADFGLRSVVATDPARLEAGRRANALLPPDGPGGLFGTSETAGAGLRLVDRYVQRRPGRAWGSFSTLVAHEYGHVVEIQRHLPLLRGLPASVALIVGCGFSPLQVEMELERRAQLAALAYAEDPDLALAEMMAALPVQARTPDAHAGGYQRAIRALAVEVYNHPARYPEIDRAYRVVPQLDRLSNEEIRQAARRILGVR